MIGASISHPAFATASRHLRRHLGVVKGQVSATLRAWSDDNASMWAASLAFYSMMSLGPLMFIVVAISSTWLGAQAARDAILAQVAETVGGHAAEAVAELLAVVQAPKVGALHSLLGAASLAFGASGVFAALQDAVNAIWHVAPRPGRGLWRLIKRRFVSMAMVVGVGFLLTVSCVVSATLAAVQGFLGHALLFGAGLARACEAAGSLVLFTIFFAAMYKVLPDARLRWRDVWSGGLVTAVLFSIGKIGLGVYLRRAHVEDAYGAAGSLALVLIWIFYAAQVFFLGAEWVRAEVCQKGGIVEPSRDAIAVETVRVDRRDELPRAG